jgi:pimeloyl-ACP methyl ester carboxylesterase
MPELTLDQGTIRYRDEGSGPTIVFVHGALVDGALWDPVIARLRGRFRCVAPDLPLGSHPIALRPDADVSVRGVVALILDFMKALDLQDVTLVGNDSGGALSQLVVTADPSRVGRLVLTPCDAFGDFPPKAFRSLVSAARVPGGLRALLLPMRVRALRRLPLAFGWLSKRPIPDAVVDPWVERPLRDPAVMADARKFLATLDPGLLLDNTPKLSSFDKPVLLAWAPEDRIFRVEHAHRLARIFPDARVEPIADAYTFVSWDQPARLAEMLEAFVAGQPAGSVAA